MIIGVVLIRETKVIKNSQQTISDSYKSKRKKDLVWMILGGGFLIIGLLILNFGEIHQEETYKKLFSHEMGTRTVITALGIFAWSITIIGGMILFLTSISFIIHNGKYRQFSSMTSSEYKALQDQYAYGKEDLHDFAKDEIKRKQLQSITLTAPSINNATEQILIGDNDYVLSYFAYNSGILDLRFKNGVYISNRLANYKVAFSSYKGSRMATIIYQDGQCHIKESRLLFSKTQWDQIFHILLLAGKTINSDTIDDGFIKASKTLNIATNAIKIASKISQ